MLLLMCAFVAVLWWRKVAAELKLAVKMAKYKLEGKCMVIIMAMEDGTVLSEGTLDPS